MREKKREEVVEVELGGGSEEGLMVGVGGKEKVDEERLL